MQLLQQTLADQTHLGTHEVLLILERLDPTDPALFRIRDRLLDEEYLASKQLTEDRAQVLATIRQLTRFQKIDYPELSLLNRPLGDIEEDDGFVAESA